MKARGQVRFVGMNAVPVGFDWPALFAFADATGVSRAHLAAFLPDAERGAVKAIRKARQDRD